jgi:hypothetical protein
MERPPLIFAGCGKFNCTREARKAETKAKEPISDVWDK